MHFEARKGRAPFGGFAPRRLSRIAGTPPCRAGAPSRSHHRRYSAQCGNIRCAAGTQRRAPRQYDDYPRASVEEVLTRLAHYCVDSRTRGLSHGSVREVIAFAINMEQRRRHHRGDVDGIDCDDGSGVRLPFTGRIGVTEVRHPRAPDRRNVRRRRSMPAASASKRHVTPAGSAAGRSGAL